MKRALLILILILAVLLRFYKLSDNPASLSWDEASLGYNAYSISDSLKDEHGEFLPLDRFIAFGDYKPPGYIYVAVFPIKLFGLSEWSVRFPSALSGILLVLFTYLLVNLLFKNKKIALIAGLLVAISPWDLHVSRAAYESHLATLFNLMAIYFFIRSREKSYFLVISVILFIFSFYTFNANRIIAPLLIAGLSILNIGFLRKNKKWVFLSVLIGIILLYPSFNFFKSPESKLRFQEVSIFNNLNTIEKSNFWMRLDGDVKISKIIHNRRVLYFLDYLKHYSQNFDLRFLFTNGDVNPRLALPGMGQLYIVELPFLILGLYWLLRYKKDVFFLLILWMLIAPIPAGVARETPHALRILSILPTFQIITAFGLDCFIKILLEERFKLFGKLILTGIVIFYIFNIYFYLHNYHIHFVHDWSGEWQYGYKEMVKYVDSNSDKYENIFVTSALGRPYIYFAFYKPYKIEKYLKERKETKDSFGFYNVNSLGKIEFSLDNLNKAIGKTLVVSTPDNIPEGFTKIKQINNLRNDGVFWIGER
jgi:4-amino-4-deoxy-L-arabinose transferase-like glycosyltransferase